MDDRVQRAMQRWPNVPAAYGWLSLDQRGRWRLEGGLVRNHTTREAINRNYAADEQGRWYYQNGPQRVFVDLAYTPWVYVLDGAGALCTHTGLAVRRLDGIWVDEDLTLLLLSERGIGVVSDVDAGSLIDRFCNADGEAMTVDAVEQHLTSVTAGASGTGVFLCWSELFEVEHIQRADVAERFGFNPRPCQE